MLVPLAEIVSHDSATFAINVSDYQFAYWLLKISNSFKQPLILQISERVLSKEGEQFLKGLLKLCQADRAVVSVNIDHCKDMSLCLKAIEWGAKGVLYDGSSLPLTQNIENTKKIVQFAKKYNAYIEGEISPIPGEEDGHHNRGGMKIPIQEIKDFANQTNVFSFAPFFGNYHGDYLGNYTGFDFEYLREVKNSLQMPLVIHGGSGMGKETVDEILKLKVGKVNFSTDFKKILVQPKEGIKDPYLLSSLIEKRVQVKFEELRELWNK